MAITFECVHRDNAAVGESLMKLAGLSPKDKEMTGWTKGGTEGGQGGDLPGTLDENKSLDEQTEEGEAREKQVRSLVCHFLSLSLRPN